MNLQEPSAVVAIGLGLWTAVQPCPMTANLAAVAYLGRRASSPRTALISALLYAAGQVIAYTVLAFLVLESVSSAWRLSAFLQQHVNQILGPIWILAAMVLLDLLPIRLPRLRTDNRGKSTGERLVAACGTWSGLPLGILLALAFCPVSATLFFVNLLTIAMAGGSHIVYPALYALGAALPVLMFAVLLTAGAGWLGAALNRTQEIQSWLGWCAGAVLLVVGIYYTLRFNF
jgi:cytochrome c biogenesis protein CcdA